MRESEKQLEAHEFGSTLCSMLLAKELADSPVDAPKQINHAAVQCAKRVRSPNIKKILYGIILHPDPIAALDKQLEHVAEAGTDLFTFLHECAHIQIMGVR